MREEEINGRYRSLIESIIIEKLFRYYDEGIKVVEDAHYVDAVTIELNEKEMVKKDDIDNYFRLLFAAPSQTSFSKVVKQIKDVIENFQIKIRINDEQILVIGITEIQV